MTYCLSLVVTYTVQIIHRSIYLPGVTILANRVLAANWQGAKHLWETQACTLIRSSAPVADGLPDSAESRYFCDLSIS
jgi:hypothetical protein